MSGVVQPLNYNPTQVASVAGNATWTLPLLAAGEMWEFTVNCPVAPSSARLTIQAGGNILGYVKGSNSWGPIQIQGGEQLVVNATGLVPGTTYYLNVLGVVVNGGSALEEKYPAAYADTTTTSVETLQLGSQPFLATNTITIYNISLTNTMKYLWVVCSLPAGTISSVQANYYVPGVVGALVSFGEPVNVNNTNGSQYYRIVNIPGSTSVNIVINLTLPGSGVIYYGVEMGIFDQFVQNTPSQPLYVSTPITSNTFHNVPYGGATVATVTTLATGATLLLAAPSAGTSRRIHSVSVLPPTATAAGNQSTFQAGTADFASLIYPYQCTLFLGGLLTTQAINVISSVATSTVWTMTYDTVTTPTIV